MFQLRMFSRSIRYAVLALSSVAIIALTSPVSAKPFHHHGAGRHVAISTEGGVLTFNGKAPHTAEIEPFEPRAPKRKLH